MPSAVKTLIAIVAYCCTSLPLTSGFLTNHNHQTTNSFTTTTSSPTSTCSSSSSSSSSSSNRSSSYPPPARSRTSTGWITNINAVASHRKSSKLFLEFPNFFSGGQFNFNPFGGNNGNNDDKDDKTMKMGDSSSDGEGAIEADGEYVASTEIFHIPAKKIKVGGLRLYLALYFMGEQNTPTRNTWRADQTPSGGIDLYYTDRTGALIITFTEESMTVGRLGSSPSMDYLMQESAIVSGMLDQLDEISDDTNIGEANRLMCLLEPGDAIETVRENLAFG